MGRQGTESRCMTTALRAGAIVRACLACGHRDERGVDVQCARLRQTG